MGLTFHLIIKHVKITFSSIAFKCLVTHLIFSLKNPVRSQQEKQQHNLNVTLLPSNDFHIQSFYSSDKAHISASMFLFI